MILPFSTQINGKPSYFVERIQKALKAAYFPEIAFSSEHCPKDFNYVVFAHCKPKMHTIREDKNDRWKVGTKIDFFINARQKNMFRFAPIVSVVSVQKIEINFYEYLNDTIIKIDDKILTIEEKQELAWNDGFDCLLEFLLYFKEDFTGKLIHWTDKRY